MPIDPNTPTLRRGTQDGTADIPEPLLSALKALVDAGQRIEAIKRYRLATGADLVTAKGVVDALAAGRKPLSGRGVGASSGTRPARLRWRVNRHWNGTPDRRPKGTPVAGRPGSPWRGPARDAQCPGARRSGTRGEALWTHRVEPQGGPGRGIRRGS